MRPPAATGAFAFLGVVDAEQFGEFIEQRCVRCAEFAVVRAREFGSVGRIQTARHPVESLRIGQQIREHLLRRQNRPEFADGRLDLRIGAHFVPNLGQIGSAEQTLTPGQVRAHGLGQLLGERVDDRGDEDRPGQVVRAP